MVSQNFKNHGPGRCCCGDPCQLWPDTLIPYIQHGDVVEVAGNDWQIQYDGQGKPLDYKVDLPRGTDVDRHGDAHGLFFRYFPYFFAYETRLDVTYTIDTLGDVFFAIGHAKSRFYSYDDVYTSNVHFVFSTKHKKMWKAYMDPRACEPRDDTAPPQEYSFIKCDTALDFDGPPYKVRHYQTRGDDNYNYSEIYFNDVLIWRGPTGGITSIQGNDNRIGASTFMPLSRVHCWPTMKCLPDQPYSDPPNDSTNSCAGLTGNHYSNADYEKVVNIDTSVPWETFTSNGSVTVRDLTIHKAYGDAYGVYPPQPCGTFKTTGDSFYRPKYKLFEVTVSGSQYSELNKRHLIPDGYQPETTDITSWAGPYRDFYGWKDPPWGQGGPGEEFVYEDVWPRCLKFSISAWRTEIGGSKFEDFQTTWDSWWSNRRFDPSSYPNHIVVMARVAYTRRDPDNPCSTSTGSPLFAWCNWSFPMPWLNLDSYYYDYLLANDPLQLENPDRVLCLNPANVVCDPRHLSAPCNISTVGGCTAHTGLPTQNANSYDFWGPLFSSLQFQIHLPPAN